MSEGELAAVFRGLAEDAGEAGEQIADSIARFTDDTADIEDANVARTLAADADTARAAASISKEASQDAGTVGGPETIGSEETFDPAFRKGALGPEFSPRVVDPSGAFTEKERAIADRLTQEGWRVDAREADPTVQYLKNPDAMVRKAPDDPGSITEFKTMSKPTNNALKREINDASDQVGADGDVVIDGRRVGTTLSDAERAYKRAIGQPGGIVAKRVHVILGDGRLITLEEEQP